MIEDKVNLSERCRDLINELEALTELEMSIRNQKLRIKAEIEFNLSLQVGDWPGRGIESELFNRASIMSDFREDPDQTLKELGIKHGISECQVSKILKKELTKDDHEHNIGT